ncbi:hypothetical protein PCANC_19155 [Puccinia coronata f. sp. avenae]|uniref:CAP-Gly domain-containing protein n=1 Tax=Puccinia coronata f. sp. avenae TaxID=200324 RepID=A0A2N5SGS9_9BASI|nr:hypothetical protein PCANC_19155 [Puccinia coronata f. sp. avenae]
MDLRAAGPGCNNTGDLDRVILDEQHVGTVRFCGSVEGQDPVQTWLGIEWDDPTRGKHSGQFKNGPALFQTSIPNSGTFMKPSKRLGTGRSFLTALKEKYLDQELLNPHSHLHQASNIAQTEEDDMRKVALRFSQLDQLRLVGLESAKINGAGNELELMELNGLLPSVETLNLSSNLFSDLNEVSTIVAKLPQLRTLVLSSNRFQSIPDTLPGLCAVKILYLDATLLTWQQAVKIARQIKDLNELSLRRCHISHFGPSGLPPHGGPSFESLCTLTLDDNGLGDWQDLMRNLRWFPRLQNLNLRRNKLTIPPMEDSGMMLNSVQQLSLLGNLITQGAEIDDLRDWLPSLSSLFLDGNPLYNGQDVRRNRLLVLARYPTLATLDGSQVTSTERAESELFYWLTIQKEASEHEQRLKSHRRYLELLAKFGSPEPDASNTRASSLKAKMLSLTVICKGSAATDRPETIEVLPSMTARGLKIYLAKMLRRCGLSQKSLSDLAASLEVRVVDSGDGLLVDMSDPQKDLGWLGISDGDTLELSFF